MGADSGHHYCTCTGQGGAPPPDNLGHKISRPTTVVRSWIRSTNAAAAANLGRRIYVFFGHFRPTHTSFPAFLDPLNSKIHHRLKATKKKILIDFWIEFSDHYSNLWTKIRVLMCSWSLDLSIDMWFVNFGRLLISFPFLGCFG